MKRTKVLLFSLVLVMFALIFSGVEFRAAEVATSDTISVKGAQVRTSDPVGIRFVGTAEGEYDAYGIAIAFGDVDVNEVVLGATINGKAVLSAEATEKDGNGYFYISLISIPAEMYGQKVTARAYVKEGKNVTYATTATTRSYYGTAKLAYEAGDKSDKVAEVYNNLPKALFDYNGGELETEYKFTITRYGGTMNVIESSYNLTIAPKSKVGYACNNSWSRIFVKAEETENLYKVVAVSPENSSHTNLDYDYVLAANSSNRDTVSRNQVQMLVNSSNATDYYVSFVAPTKTVCNVVVKASTNPNELMNSGTYYDLGDDLPTLTKENHEFIGWYDNEELTGLSTLVNTGASKYYAKFVQTIFTISYDLGEGETSVELVESYRIDDDNIVLPDASSMYVYNGVFLGWYDNSEFTGDPITTIDTSKGKDIQLYAKWDINPYTNVELSAADTVALNALTPTIVVSPNFKSGIYIINGNEYVMNETAFASVTDASNALSENDKMYLFAGTYSGDLTIRCDNVICYGPNYNIKGTDTRNAEASISGNVVVAANKFTLDGFKFSGKKIYIAKNISNLTSKNIVSTSNGDYFLYDQNLNGLYQQGVIGSPSYSLDGLVVSGCKFTIVGKGSRDIFAFYGVLSNVDINNNYFDNGGTTSGLCELFRAEKVSGVFNFENNYCLFSTGSATIQLGYIYNGATSNTCTEMNIVENTFAGGTSASRGLQIQYVKSNAVVKVIGNNFVNVGGGTLNFNYSELGASINVMYNNFDAKTSYREYNSGSGVVNYVNNYYAKEQSTVTSDYGVITTLDALEAAYAAYKGK